MMLTPRAKRVIDLSYDEARQLSNEYIGTEHLLLGLIREGEGLAASVLAKLGVNLEATRKEVQLLQDNDSGKPGSVVSEPIDTENTDVLRRYLLRASANEVYAAIGQEKAVHVLRSLEANGSIWCAANR